MGRPKTTIVAQLQYPTDVNNIDDLDTKPIASKRQRINWFDSPYIHDILHAYSLCKTAYRTVQHLQKSYQKRATEEEARYEQLRESTIISWFDKNGTLLKQYSDQLAAGFVKDYSKRGKKRVLDRFPDLENTIKVRLLKMREKSNIGIADIRAVMCAIIKKEQPDLLHEISLSSSFISLWARVKLNWRIRRGTTAQSKLPIDWHEQGATMIKRLAILIKQENIRDRSLIINFDQTGIHLVPHNSYTYDKKGAREVQTYGKDDKRQITAVVASADGQLLPLQLIFQGKTNQCHHPVPDHMLKLVSTLLILITIGVIKRQ